MINPTIDDLIRQNIFVTLLGFLKFNHLVKLALTCKKLNKISMQEIDNRFTIWAKNIIKTGNYSGEDHMQILWKLDKYLNMYNKQFDRDSFTCDCVFIFGFEDEDSHIPTCPLINTIKYFKIEDIFSPLKFPVTQ